jgi:hypothetical protein
MSTAVKIETLIVMGCFCMCGWPVKSQISRQYKENTGKFLCFQDLRVSFLKQNTGQYLYSFETTPQSLTVTLEKTRSLKKECHLLVDRALEVHF